MSNEQNEKQLAFVSFCVEQYKARLKCSGSKVIEYFEKFGVLDYLLEHYDVLHSMDADVILNDIDAYIRVREAK